VNANGTNGETKATGAAAKAARQAKMSVVRTDEQTTELTTPPVEQPKAQKQPAKPKAEKPPKPEVNRLEKVIEQQSAPTMWQYARIAKQIKQRLEAGQGFDDAFAAVIQQTQEILLGILGREPATSSDADIDSATKGYFESERPASMQRARGPKDPAPETSGK
jgi:hypothetical protein